MLITPPRPSSWWLIQDPGDTPAVREMQADFKRIYIELFGEEAYNQEVAKAKLQEAT